MNTPFQNRIKKQQRRNEKLMRKAARISARQSGESMGGIDYELPKVQKVLGKINKAKTISYNDVDPRIEEQGKRYDSGINYGSPLNSAYASGAGGARYVSTAGAFQRLQDDISAGIQADLANRKAKAAAEAKAAKKAEKKQKKFKEATEKFKNKDYSLDVPKFEVTSISEFDKKNNDNLFYQ